MVFLLHTVILPYEVSLENVSSILLDKVLVFNTVLQFLQPKIQVKHHYVKARYLTCLTAIHNT